MCIRDRVVNVEECGPNVLKIIFTMDNIKIYMSRPCLLYTSRRADKMSIALNQSEENYLVSSISTVIQTDNTKLLPKYLYLFFCRTESVSYTHLDVYKRQT